MGYEGVSGRGLRNRESWGSFWLKLHFAFVLPPSPGFQSFERLQNLLSLV